MKVLGVELAFPNKSEWPGLVLMLIIYAAIVAALVLFGVVSREGGLIVSAALCSGTLSNAYGAGIVEHGWRALVICAGFTVAMVGLVTLVVLISGI